MAGATKFSIAVNITNGDALPELAARVKDFAPVFYAFIPEWVKLNEQKFDKSVGMEVSGADISSDVFWDPLSPEYRKQKRRRGFPNQIMVATGALRDALTNPDRIFQRVEAMDATFGTPTDPDDVVKAKYNSKRRQVIFLGPSDMNALRRIVKDYLSFGSNFQAIRHAQGAYNRRVRSEMNEEFDLGNIDGDF